MYIIFVSALAAASSSHFGAVTSDISESIWWVMSRIFLKPIYIYMYIEIDCASCFLLLWLSLCVRKALGHRPMSIALRLINI